MKNHLLHSLNLKCDAPNCDYERVVPEISAQLIGETCPKCGAVLLTKDDFESAQIMMGVLDGIAEIVPESAVENVEPGDVLLGLNPHNDELKLSLRPVK